MDRLLIDDYPCGLQRAIGVIEQALGVMGKITGVRDYNEHSSFAMSLTVAEFAILRRDLCSLRGMKNSGSA